MPVPLDEYPIHQTPLSMRYVGTSDRNFYDRCYFNAHDRSGDIFLITGMGYYQNLGVTDAYATVRRGDRQWAVRISDAYGDDTRLNQSVGPYRIEVLEPLHRVRVICDADEQGIGFDLTWEGSFDAVDEGRHYIRQGGPRTILNTSRFAQLGSWSGEIRVDGDRIDVQPDVWLGSRDRSWGIRPLGDPEPPGRLAEEGTEGFWWLYVPVRFDDFAIVIIVQEGPDGYRTLNDATRIWRDGRIEQLGWPRVELSYRSGTRHPESARIHLTEPSGKALTLEVETLLGVALHVGAGYGGDPEWAHGQWKGRNWIEGKVFDLTDPAIIGRLPFGVTDHVARATLDGNEGWGLFEHATVGRHDPTGFTDFMSVAP